jgi:hypothetical protein
MVNQNLYPTLNTWSINLLLKWHRQDPVSQKEIDRNEAVYGFQNNRNPFIDYPELAEYIWGTYAGQPFTPGAVDDGGDPNLITPTQDMNLDFGEVAIGGSVTRQLFFHGENLKGSLDLALYSGDREMFKLPSNSLSASLVNADDGYWLNITYTPTALGEHQTKLLVSEGGIVGSRGITLRGSCLEVPTLTACTALAATDITSDSYVANWTAPEDEVIDYYIVNRTRYVNGQATLEELVAEDTQLLIDDFNGSDKEAYTVQSVRLGHRSPESNVIFVDHSGVTGVVTDQPLAIVAISGGVRFICNTPQTGCRIYDVAGRMIMSLDQVSQNMDVALPLGAYIITTDQHKSPVKLVVRQ